MSDRDELKIIVLAHIGFFKGPGFHNHCSQKRRTLYHHVRTAEIFRDTLVNTKVVKKENSTAMSGEDLQ
jgi:hypothetical protein